MSQKKNERFEMKGKREEYTGGIKEK